MFDTAAHPQRRGAVHGTHPWSIPARAAIMNQVSVEPLVHIRNFRMDFGNDTVVRDLSFDVHRGETFGFLGS
ncbi:MAG TPA: hypothetical protein VFH61_01665, partial [Thermoleophilia bacterium]|nr:hypothetical protein [Thermoleophilia bacterium]